MIDFPTSLDTLTNPISTDTMSGVSHSTQHTNENDAIEALEAKVGINSSTEITSHDYLIQNSLPTHSMSRQAIINGNFDVWQRGTSFTMTAASTTYGPDRWRDSTAVDGGTNPTLTRSRQVLTSGDLPGSFFFNRLTTDGAGSSLGNGSYYISKQCIENGVRNLCGLGKKVTLSFWAKSDIANKKIGINIRQVYGTGGSPTAAEEINGASWTLTSTWTKYTYTFTTNTLVGKTFGTAYDDFLEYQFWYAWGTTYKDKVGAAGAETYVGSGNIDIAQVQLCAGEVALPFQPKSFEEELRACQRYYEKSYDYATAPGTATRIGTAGTVGYDATQSFSGGGIVYKVYKRAIPTVSFWDHNGSAGKAEYVGVGSITIAVTSIFSGQSGCNGFTTAGFGANGKANFQWAADAEL